MRLRALDQINISAVQGDSLRPGQEFEVSDELGKELLQKHPKVFEKLAAEASNKVAPTPKNKSQD